MRLRNIRRDDAGATAVEYGLIAGLIALGILGSLVGTRASLSSALGTAASGVGGSVSTPATGAGHWQAKTYAAGYPKYVVGSNFQQATYSYSDGSFVTMTKVLNSDGSVYAYRGELVDASRSAAQKAYFYTDPAGVQNLFQITNYTGPDRTSTANYTQNTAYNGAESTYTYLYPGTSNGTTTSSTGPATAAFRSMNDVYASEYGYFYGLGFVKPN